MANHYEVAGRSFAFMSCGKCGVEFMMPSHFQRECSEQGDKRTWYCPNGHPRVYSESEADTLRRERDRLKQQAARLEDEKRAAERLADAAKAETARLRKRIGNGVCPCCNRSFANVAKHMKSKHPDVVPLRKPA